MPSGFLPFLFDFWKSVQTIEHGVVVREPLETPRVQGPNQLQLLLRMSSKLPFAMAVSAGQFEIADWP